MKDKWIARLAQINKELLLIFSIVASAALVNFFIEGQRLVLTFYNLPTLFAVYYFGRRRAVQAAVATILFVTWVDVMHPAIFNHSAVASEICSAGRTWRSGPASSSFLPMPPELSTSIANSACTNCARRILACCRFSAR